MSDDLYDPDTHAQPGDLYNPEVHHQKASTSVAASGGKFIKRLFWYGLGLFLGMGSASVILKALRTFGDDSFVNSNPEQAGAIFGSLIGGVICLFLAVKCLGKGREVL